MNFTINVHVTGLEGIVSLIEKLVSGGPVNISTAPTSAPANPAPMSAPVVAPVMMAAQPQIQPQPPVAAPVMQAPPVNPAPAIAPVGAVPTVAATYTIDQIAVAATQLVDAGRRNELVQLLASFGVQALTELPKEHYGAFATQLRAMGAKL